MGHCNGPPQPAYETPREIQRQSDQRRNQGGSGERQAGEGKQFTCQDAMIESGKVRATGFNVTAVLGLGWTVTRGSWVNLSTNTSGRFTTVGFAAGLEMGAGATIVTYSSIGALTGWSDSYSMGASLPLGPVAIGGAYQHSSNNSGSGSGGFGGVGPAAGFRPPGASGSFTETTISQCKPRG